MSYQLNDRRILVGFGNRWTVRPVNQPSHGRCFKDAEPKSRLREYAPKKHRVVRYVGQFVRDNTGLALRRARAGQGFSPRQRYYATIGKLDIPPDKPPASFNYIFRAGRKSRGQTRGTEHFKSSALSCPQMLPDEPRRVRFVTKLRLSPFCTGVWPRFARSYLRAAFCFAGRRFNICLIWAGVFPRTS